MNVIKIPNSYNVWNPAEMRKRIEAAHSDPEAFLNRTFRSMIVEWWLHNIGYYVSLPQKSEAWRKINLRCRDVDLEEWSHTNL